MLLLDRLLIYFLAFYLLNLITNCTFNCSHASQMDRFRNSLQCLVSHFMVCTGFAELANDLGILVLKI